MLGAELLSNLYDKLGRLLTNPDQPTSWQVGETDTHWHTKNVFIFVAKIPVNKQVSKINLKSRQPRKTWTSNVDDVKNFYLFFVLSSSANLHIFFQHTEALLYGFQSIAETIDVNYSDVIPGLIGLIPRININNVQLADTVMFTIGKVMHFVLRETLWLIYWTLDTVLYFTLYVQL